MGKTSTAARRGTLKVTSADGFEPLIPEEGIFHFPADSTTILDNFSHLCFGPEKQGLAREQQAKLEKLLGQVALAAPGKSLETLMGDLKAGAPEAVGLNSAGYILRIRLHIQPREEQVWKIIVFWHNPIHPDSRRCTSTLSSFFHSRDVSGNTECFFLTGPPKLP